MLVSELWINCGEDTSGDKDSRDPSFVSKQTTNLSQTLTFLITTSPILMKGHLSSENAGKSPSIKILGLNRVCSTSRSTFSSLRSWLSSSSPCAALSQLLETPQAVGVACSCPTWVCPLAIAVLLLCVITTLTNASTGYHHIVWGTAGHYSD